MDKIAARESIIKKLRTHESCQEKSSAIKDTLVSMDEFEKAANIFIYLSDGVEVGTREIIDTALNNGKDVYCPMMVGDGIEAGMYATDLRPGKFGIMEPKTPSKLLKFDLIIIPGVAFGRDGSRAGRGGGHFDRFLAKTTGKKIALAFDFQIVDKIDTQPHDVPVDMIITETQIIDIKNNNPLNKTGDL